MRRRDPSFAAAVLVGALLLACDALAAPGVRQCVRETCRPAGRECIRAFRDAVAAELVACAESRPAKGCRRRVRAGLRRDLRTCAAAVGQCAACCRDGGAPCPVAVCGNGLVEGGEACDGSSTSACPGGCRGDCTCTPFCGDGTTDPGEACDGTADAACPGRCRPDCTCTPAPPPCGDGALDAGEACDGLADAACPGRCRDDCTCAPEPSACGNGTVDPGEECDGEAHQACEASCGADCTCDPPVCGNGVVGGIEVCDGDDDDACPGLCRDDCTCAVCGNDVVEPGETCEPASDPCSDVCSPYSCMCVSATTDECTAPRELVTLPAVDRQSIVSATHAGDDPDLSCIFPQDARSVWYAVTAPATGRIRADAAGSSYDTVLAAHTGACGALTERSCVDDADGTTTARLDFPVAAGERYLIEAASYFDVPGDLVLSVDFRPCGDGTLDPGEDCEPSHPEACGSGPCTPRCTCLAPPADECMDADVVTALPVAVRLAAGQATSNPADPGVQCGTQAASAKSAWFRFRAPTDGTVVVETIGSDYDTILGVFTGGCDALVFETCNDDVTYGYQSSLELPVTAGVDYTVLVVPYAATVPDELDLAVRYVEASP